MMHACFSTQARHTAATGALVLFVAAGAFAESAPTAAPASTEAPAPKAATESPPAAAPSAEAPPVEAPTEGASAPTAEPVAAETSAKSASAGDAAAVEAPPESAPAEEPPPVVSTLDFEAAGYMSLLFAQLAVPDEGSLVPLGAGGYVAMRYVPTTFPFHAFFETGGGLFATGSATGPSGTRYNNVLSALFFTPGIGLDVGPFRLTYGMGPALILTNRSSVDDDISTVGVAVAADVGLSYRFFERGPLALSAGLRYQSVPGAKIDALSLGVQFRFGSIAYR